MPKKKIQDPLKPGTRQVAALKVLATSNEPMFHEYVSEQATLPGESEMWYRPLNDLVWRKYATKAGGHGHARWQITPAGRRALKEFQAKFEDS